MPFLLFAYVVMTVLFAVTGGWKAGLGVGVYTLATAALFVLSGGRLKQLARERWGRGRRGKDGSNTALAGVVLAIILAGVGQWLSAGFTVHVGGYGFDGWVWGWLGFVVAFLAF